MKRVERSVHLPPKLAETTKTWWGEDGPRWVAELPDGLADLEARWRVTLGPPFEPGGYTSYVAPAEGADGSSVVVKVAVPDEESRLEAEALRIWDGDGAVRLLKHAPDHHAMLLERCVPGTPIADMEDDRAADEIAAGLVQRLWRKIEDGHAFTTLADAAAGWAQQTKERFDRLRPTLDAGAVARACRLMRDLPATTDRTVLIHGDFHPWNVLAAEREPWLAIDAKPLVGDPAFDLARYITNRLDIYIGGGGTSRPYDPREMPRDVGQPRDALADLLRRLVAATGLEEERLLGWALVRQVEGAIWLTEVGDPDPLDRERIEHLGALVR